MSTKTLERPDAAQVVEKVRTSADSLKNTDIRTPGSMSPGDFGRQGDLYFTALDRVPKGAKLDEKPSLQLAPGETQGSRHCLDSLEGVKVYRVPSANAIQGPVLDLTEARTVEHPEHAHVRLEPGVYAVTHQRSYAEELRAVRD